MNKIKYSSSLSFISGTEPKNVTTIRGIGRSFKPSWCIKGNKQKKGEGGVVDGTCDPPVLAHSLLRKKVLNNDNKT